MPKINQEEYEILKGLDNMWKWIAREEDRGLYAFTKKPVRKSGRIGPSYWDAGAGWSHPVLELIDEIHLFQFIQWEDEEPYNIAELIEEYESGETEVNKQELTKNIKSLARETSQQWPHEEMVELPDVLELINQLDEPEVLSDEWIDEHLFVLGDKYPWKEAVPVADLQNLLVPKQELPVIPQFVADWIEVAKESGYDLLGVIYDGAYNENVGSWMFEGKKNKRHLNRNKIARAWLDGYTVEEKKYRVILETRDMDKEEDFLGMYPEGKWYVHLDSCFEITGTGLKHTIESFTEQEIKDFDERYWAFAEPVEEEEE